MRKKRTDFSKAKTWLTVYEWRKLSRVRPVNLRDLLIVHLLYGCALRASELLALKASDIEIREKVLIIQKSKNCPTPTRVPIPTETMRWLKMWLKEAKPGSEKNLLWPNRKKIDRKRISRRVNSIAKKAKLTKTVTPHTLRRSRATHLLDSGLSLERVSQLLRHRKLETTMIYLKLSTKQLASEMRKVDILEG